MWFFLDRGWFDQDRRTLTVQDKQTNDPNVSIGWYWSREKSPKKQKNAETAITPKTFSSFLRSLPFSLSPSHSPFLSPFLSLHYLTLSLQLFLSLSFHLWHFLCLLFVPSLKCSSFLPTTQICSLTIFSTLKSFSLYRTLFE